MTRGSTPDRSPLARNTIDRTGSRVRRAATDRRWAALLVPLALSWSYPAAAQSPESQDRSGLDFFRPPPNLFQFQYEYRTAPGSTRDVTTQTLNLRYDHAFYLTPTWTVVTRTDLPLLGRNTINSSNPNGNYIYGLGDADIQAAVIHDLDKRWAVGFGARLITPTGEDPLGSGKWRIMPIVGFRVALPEISKSSYFEPIFRYDVSVAGDLTRRNISNLQFGPALNIGLPDRWFVTFYPSQDIRINFGDPVAGQTGRLFLPLDVRAGKKLSDNVAASLEIGVPIIKDYPVYNFKSQFRLNITW
ncbi:transporter [Bradyrhizobium japonicum]|uniref:transporter n=1 Tax=Bradyrhizobium japonicum TaxID=375 RepID=UPI001BA5A6D6|nr:transporter [Bradyrhizobium japonicum]